MKDGAEVTDVTFMLDDQEFTSGTIEVAPGTYDVEIVEPEGLVPTAEFETVTIDKDTKNLTIELEEGKPAPQGEGTLKFEVWESDGNNEKQINNFIMANANNEFLYNNEEKSLPYGEYTVKLSSTWNMGGLYDEAKSKIKETVTLDETHKNVVVKFILVKKGSTPSPDPDPDPTPEGKGLSLIHI